MPSPSVLSHRALCASSVVSVALLAAACGAREPALEDPDPLVVASMFPLGALAAWVGGDDVRVQVLVPPRADPSTFEPSPRQLDNLADARAFLMVGGGMDDWVERIPGGVDGIPVTRVNEGLALREGGEGEGTGDPHTWLDPVLVRDAWLPRIVA